MKKISLFLIGCVLVLGGCSFFGDNTANNNQNIDVSIIQNNSNSTQLQNKTYTGTVFIKGYQTPSESYGLITESGDEIGLGEYDHHKEIFRDLVNQDIIVNFTSICQSGTNNCCRSLFYYCGQINSWQRE